MLNIQIMRRIVEESYITAIYAEYGDRGTHALRVVLDVLPGLYGRIEPELFREIFVVFHRLPDADEAPPQASAAREVRGFGSLVNAVSDGCAVEVLEREHFRIWSVETLDLAQLADSAIVYVYEPRRESFMVRGRKRPVLNPDPVHASVFAQPTFSSLLDALEDYRNRLLRTSGCAIFSDVWADPNRLFLKPKSEKVMRLSLHQHLQRVLRDAEVRPEQVVDETHPVDLKVTWSFTNRLALIEIKWLGKARGEDGITTPYFDQRARDGAKQLAEYLDANREMTATYITRGYLVIIDARRYGLNDQSTTISYVEGMYYADRDVEFDPEYHRLRPDFEVPVRMFAEPVCT